MLWSTILIGSKFVWLAFSLEFQFDSSKEAEVRLLLKDFYIFVYQLINFIKSQISTFLASAYPRQSASTS